MFNGIMSRYSVLTSTETDQAMWKLWIDIH